MPPARENCISPLSPSSVSLYDDWPLSPERFSSSRMLTTPATASEPYAADAPPVTTSMRSISIAGIRLTSTVPREELGTKRRPLTSTSVREAPRPRRSSVRAPMLEALRNEVDGECVARNAGS